MRYWARAVAVASVGVGVAGCASAPPPSGVVTPPPTLDQQITACSAIDDMTKDRLDCFDAIPVPPPGPAAAIVIVQCRAVTEQDARLRCFDKLLIALRRRRRPGCALAPQLPITSGEVVVVADHAAAQATDFPTESAQAGGDKNDKH